MNALRFFAGYGIGKRLPFLWRIYDLWRLLGRTETVHDIGGVKLVISTKEKEYRVRQWLYNYESMTEYEPNTTRIIRKLVNKDSYCIDIGASIGYFSVLMGQLGKQVLSFEPTHRGFKYLCKNIELNGLQNVKPFHLAAWDENEIVKVPLCDPDPIYANGCRIADVVDRADFIKMDIDGAEPWALRGLIPLIEKSPNLVMVMEYFPKYILRAGGDPKEVMEILDKYFTYEVIDGDYGDGCWNYLCKRKNGIIKS